MTIPLLQGGRNDLIASPNLRPYFKLLKVSELTSSHPISRVHLPSTSSRRRPPCLRHRAISRRLLRQSGTKLSVGPQQLTRSAKPAVNGNACASARRKEASS